MKKRFHILRGKTDLKGNFLASMESFKKWAAGHPNRQIIARFELVDSEASHIHKAYYWKAVVPEIQFIYTYANGQPMTLGQTDEEIRRNCPFAIKETYNELTGKLESDGLKEIDDMTDPELSNLIGWVKRWAEENFDLIIE